LKPETSRRRRAPVEVYEAIAVFAAAVRDNSTTGVRDTCIIALLCGVGLRDLDLLALQLEDYDRASGRLAFGRQSVGQAELSSGAKAVLGRWLALRGLHSGPLINPVARPHRIVTRPLSRTTLSDVLFRRARAARIDPFTPDDIRRTGVLLNGGLWYVSVSAQGSKLFPLPKFDRLMGTPESIVEASRRCE